VMVSKFDASTGKLTYPPEFLSEFPNAYV